MLTTFCCLCDKKVRKLTSKSDFEWNIRFPPSFYKQPLSLSVLVSNWYIRTYIHTHTEYELMYTHTNVCDYTNIIVRVSVYTHMPRYSFCLIMCQLSIFHFIWLFLYVFHLFISFYSIFLSHTHIHEHKRTQSHIIAFIPSLWIYIFVRARSRNYEPMVVCMYVYL